MDTYTTETEHAAICDNLADVVAETFSIPKRILINGTTSPEKAKARYAYFWQMNRKLHYTPMDIARFYRRYFKTFIYTTTIRRGIILADRLIRDDDEFQSKVLSLGMEPEPVVKVAPSSDEEPIITSITFQKQWLENYIIRFFNLQENIFITTSEFSKDRMFKCVALATFAAFSGMPMKNIAKRYHLSYSTLWRLVQKGVVTGHYKKINESLRAFIPKITEPNPTTPPKQ